MHIAGSSECFNLEALKIKVVVSVTLVSLGLVSPCLQTLLMAHALHRVSLSTARPIDGQFAFVSHNPGSTAAQLYCHVFEARHARAVRRHQCHCPFYYNEGASQALLFVKYITYFKGDPWVGV